MRLTAQLRLASVRYREDPAFHQAVHTLYRTLAAECLSAEDAPQVMRLALYHYLSDLAWQREDDHKHRALVAPSPARGRPAAC